MHHRPLNLDKNVDISLKRLIEAIINNKIDNSKYVIHQNYNGPSDYC